MRLFFHSCYYTAHVTTKVFYGPCYCPLVTVLKWALNMFILFLVSSYFLAHVILSDVLLAHVITSLMLLLSRSYYYLTHDIIISLMLLPHL